MMGKMSLEEESYSVIKHTTYKTMFNVFLNRLIILFITAISIASCSEKIEDMNYAELNDYFPLQTGKYIVYQLDSLVYINFGTRDTTISYQVKYVNDGLLNDNGNTKTFRLLRYIRKNANQPWVPEAACSVLQTGNQIRLIENGLEFIKLQKPLNNGFSWKGNAYIETNSINSAVRYLDNWNYIYANVGSTENLANNETVQTLMVKQRDEVIGMADNPDSYSEINFAEEKYAKGIGMVYRKFFHKEYQPGNGSGGYVAEGSYGVTYTMIDHN